MWLSKKLNRETDSPGACVGAVTIGGENAAVFTNREARNLGVYAPGGYLWKPRKGDSVLVIKGEGESEDCIVATKIGGQLGGMESGEVYIHAGGASIYLKNDGSVCINGKLMINGVEYVPALGIGAQEG